MSMHQRFREGVAVWLCAATILASEGSLKSQEVSSLNPVAQQALSDLSITLERPLFAISRHKPASPVPSPRVAAPLPPTIAPPSVVLMGIMESNEDKYAVLRGSAEKIFHVRVGDDVSGWKIAEIASRRVTFSLNERTSSVSLFQNQGVKPSLKNARVGRGQQIDDNGIRGD